MRALPTLRQVADVIVREIQRYESRISVVEKIVQCGVHESEMKSAVESIQELRTQVLSQTYSIMELRSQNACLALKLVDLTSVVRGNDAESNRYLSDCTDRVFEIYDRLGLKRTRDLTGASRTGCVLVPVKAGAGA